MYKILGADQREYGPVDLEQLKVWIFEGQVEARTLVLKEGSREWKPLSEYSELSEALAGASTSSRQTPPSLGPTAAGSSQESIPNYLVPAILCTLCCCLPIGAVAIIYSAQVNKKLDAGDEEGARAASRKARTWCWIAFVTGAIMMFVYQLMIQYILDSSGL